MTGEAIADLGGLLLAYRAFHASAAYAGAPTIEGYSPDQQFFLSFAHFWGQSLRPEQARMYAASDPHPPGKNRVNGTLANVPQFAQAFGGAVPATAPKRCVIW